MTTLFTPIRDQRLSDKVTEQLMQAIRSGKMPVGTRLLPEEQLAEQFGVSRGILREALTVLEARGIIRRTPKGGTTVISVSGDDRGRILFGEIRKATYQDLLEFREVMECRAVENIIKLATDEQLLELRDIAAGHGGMGSEEQCAAPNNDQLDRYFHYWLAVLSGNSLFQSFIDTYFTLIREIRTHNLQSDKRRAEVNREHLAIVNALAARDTEAARQAIMAHLQAVRNYAEEYPK